MAVCGLLQGYDSIKKFGERRIRYVEKSEGINKLTLVSWANKDNTLSKKEVEIIEGISRQLIVMTEERPLGLLKTVTAQLLEDYPDGLPKKFPLPLARHDGGSWVRKKKTAPEQIVPKQQNHTQTVIDELASRMAEKSRQEILRMATSILSELPQTSVKNNEPERISHKWGPERPTYTMSKLPTRAVFNSVIDNPEIGDERCFMSIRPIASDIPRSRHIVVEPNRQYEVSVYYHNDAAFEYNQKAHNHIGVAGNVRLSLGFPAKLKADESGSITGRIISDGTELEAVWDVIDVVSTDDIALRYVVGSAKIHNKWGKNGSVLSINLFSQKGTYIGTNDLNGVIPGGLKFAGYVTYVIQTTAITE